MNICISNTVVEFGPSTKKIQGKFLQKRRIVETRRTIVNTTYECITPVLATSMESNNTSRSAYTDKNNLYQGSKQKIPIIRTLRPINYHQKVIKQQYAPSPNVMKTSDSLLIYGDDEMVQHIIPINKPGPQDIFALGIK